MTSFRNGWVYRRIRIHYYSRREPDFGVTSVNYKLTELLAKGEPPR
jgi:hypothetical protein